MKGEKLQIIEYLDNKQSFWNEIKSIFHKNNNINITHWTFFFIILLDFLFSFINLFLFKVNENYRRNLEKLWRMKATEAERYLIGKYFIYCYLLDCEIHQRRLYYCYWEKGVSTDLGGTVHIFINLMKNVMIL